MLDGIKYKNTVAIFMQNHSTKKPSEISMGLAYLFFKILISLCC